MDKGLFARTFPWREGNSFQLLVDGGAVFPAMLEAIANARDSIVLEMYLVESGAVWRRFAEALEAALQRGVAVYFLLDAFGARGLSQRDHQHLRLIGVKLALHNPLRYGGMRRNLFRDHRKLMIIDGSEAFVGGFGLTDAFDPEVHPLDYWHDVGVRLRGPVVADWLAAFARDWRHWSDEVLALEADTVLESPGQRGRVASGRGIGAAGIQRNFIRRVLRAEQRVWMMTAYFVPSLRLRKALRGAAKRGVDVRLLVPGPSTDHPAVRYAGRRFFTSLLRAGVRIYEYQPRFLHAKILVCDRWVSLGSCNLDRWNLRWNLEGNQEVDDEAFTKQVRELFVADQAVSEECLLPHWLTRPRYLRWNEWLWGLVDSWLERLGKGRREGDD